MMKSKKEIKRIAVVIAVILIPLIYSFFYLYAFWDPYSKLSDLPVAVVNEDKGAEINGEFKNAGQEVLDELKNDNSLKWVITDRQDADYGVNERKYYAEIRIPEDFSQKLSTAGKEQKIEGIIIYQPNEKRNFLAAQVLNRGMLEFKDKVSRNITKEIVNNIVVEVKKLPDDLREMNDGLGKMADGAETISDGITELKDKQQQFNDGISKLNKGIGDAKVGAAKLADGSKILASKQQEFYNSLSAGAPGLEKLVHGSAEFYSNLSALNEGLAALNKAMTQPDGGLNTFANGAFAFSKGLQQFSGGVDTLESGAVNLSKGADTYAAGTKAYTDNLEKYFSSVKALTSTNRSIAEMLSAYVKAHPEAMKDKNIQNILSVYEKSQPSLEQLDQATDLLDRKSGEVLGGAQQLQAGSKKVSDGIAMLGDKSRELFAGAQQLSAGAEKVGGGIKQMSGAVEKLADGSSKLTGAYPQINGGIKSVSDNMALAAQASGLLAGGAKGLAGGAEKLNSGLEQAYSGSGELKRNAGKFTDAEQKLIDGAKKLKDGISEANGKVSDAVQKAGDKVKEIDGIDGYASEPVKLEESRVNPVPDYGTAFSPYFISLSLWVGALVMFFGIYLDSEVKFEKTSRKSHGIVRFFSYSLLGMAQALVLGLVIKNGLGLEVKNSLMFYLVCILVSLTFISIVQFLIVHLGDVGKFLAILFLILQLTACGGTFPMEIVPKFFNSIYAFMPMTYSVNALREVISGVDYKFLQHNELILAGFMLIFLTTSFIISKRKEAKTESKVEGEVTEQYS